MAQINPHINFNSNAEEAFTFYGSVFGGTFKQVLRLKDLASDAFPISAEDADKIMLITLPIGEHTVLIGNDVPAFMGKVNEREKRSKISIRAESRSEADYLFNGLSPDGEIEVPMSDSPWNSYFGMFRDQYGIEGIVEYRQD